MRLSASLGLALLALGACDDRAPARTPRGGPGATEAEGSASSPDGPLSPLDALSTPAPFDDALIDELRRALVASADPSRFEGPPDYGAEPEELADETPTGPQVTPGEMDTRALVEEPEPAERGPRATVNPRLFRRAPRATIAADGTVTVRFAVTRAVPAVSVYYGAEVPEDPFAMARLRRVSTDLAIEEGAHTVRFDLRGLLREQYDVGRTLTRGHGLLRWRVEALDPSHGTTRVHDGRTAFSCAPLPCTAESELAQLPTVVLGPFVDRVDHESATISFETDVPTAALVALRREGGRVRQARGDVSTRHELSLTGLTPGTRYRYLPLVADGRGRISLGRSATFATWPAPDEDTALRFAVMSDSRSGLGTADEQYAGTNRQVLGDLMLGALREGARFTVFVGDLIDGYRTHAGSVRYELRAWQKATEPVAASMPIYEAMGNHEALIEYWTPGWAVGAVSPTSMEALFGEHFVNPDNGPSAPEGAPPYTENVYSFDAGPAHLAVVNTNYFWRSHFWRDDHPAADRGQGEGWIDDTQLAWLEADLAAARERGQRHLFVFTHEPGFPNGGHVQDGMWWEGRHPEMVARRDRFFRVLSEHGVAAVFHGDEHNYSRTRVHGGLVDGLERPLWQIISGGAGAPYYAQAREVPWASDVAAFDARQHFVLIDIDGEAARARVVSRTGETIDRFDLGAVE